MFEKDCMLLNANDKLEHWNNFASLRNNWLTLEKAKKIKQQQLQQDRINKKIIVLTVG